jgi:type II secretion system protein G
MQHQRGFTLIEILIVMVIIGILATLSIGSFQSSQQKARDAERKSDLQQIANSLEAYYNDYGQYPASTLTFKLTGCAGGGECDWGDPFVDDNGTTYMVELPADPKAQHSYYYVSNGTYYQLYARLENTMDAEVPLVGGEPANYGIECGTEDCNYGVSSANRTVSQGRTIMAD